MNKANYQFNPETLSFEKIEKKFSKRLYKVIFPQFILSLILGIIIFSVSSMYIASPAELKLKEKSNELKLKYELLNNQFGKIENTLIKLQTRDDEVYRMIFQVAPVPKSKRLAGIGGGERYKDFKRYKNGNLIIKTSNKTDNIAKRMLVQSESYDEIIDLVNSKEKMASCIPAIQPIALNQLTRFGSAFGRRFHPIDHVWKMHTGVDLTAPRGTPVHASGDGIVARAGVAGGYGNHIRINHGYGYLTLYGHLSKILVRPGQRVKRGDIIGLVGSTGKSTCPHLHYEVRINGKWVNPINFYYNDLTNEEYQKMLEVSASAETHVYE